MNIEKAIEYYGDSIKLTPYNYKDLKKYPELEEKLTLYQNTVKVACVQLQDLNDEYQAIRKREAEKFQDIKSRCVYSQEIEHLENGVFRLHLNLEYVPEEYTETPEYKIKERYSDYNLYLLVNNILYKVGTSSGYSLSDFEGRTLQLTSEEMEDLSLYDKFPSRITKFPNIKTK